MPIQTPTILLVEDNPVDMEIMNVLLSPFYDVDSCLHGALALEMLKHKNYDLLISDIVMPVMGGIELATVVGAHYPKIPVLIISNRSWEYHGYRENYPNVKHWVNKPFKPSTLVGLVAGTIAENSPINYGNQTLDETE